MAERAKPAAPAAPAPPPPPHPITPPPPAPAFALIIVGAGPAGLSAALTAARHGLAVVVVDEQHDAGGQIFRQPPPTFSTPPSNTFHHSTSRPPPPSGAPHGARSTAPHSARLCGTMRAAAGPSSGDSAPRPGACSPPRARGACRWPLPAPATANCSKPGRC